MLLYYCASVSNREERVIRGFRIAFSLCTFRNAYLTIIDAIINKKNCSEDGKSFPVKIVLSSKPTGNVRIQTRVDFINEIRVTQQRDVDFGESNWNIAQEVSLHYDLILCSDTTWDYSIMPCASIS